jgi:hypothetical protein
MSNDEIAALIDDELGTDPQLAPIVRPAARRPRTVTAAVAVIEPRRQHLLLVVSVVSAIAVASFYLLIR